MLQPRRTIGTGVVMKKSISIVVAIAAIAGVFALGWSAGSGGSSANAATTQSTALTTALAGSTTGNGANAKQRYESFVVDVAAKAGISSNTLDQAIRSVAVSKVQAAEKAGKIKAATATKVETAIKNGTLDQLIQQRVQARRARGGFRPFARLRRLVR
jgi:hypothetical protein